MGRGLCGEDCRLTQQRHGLEQAADLFTGPQACAASVGEAAEAVHPAQQPVILRLRLAVQLLQQLGGDGEAVLEWVEQTPKFTSGKPNANRNNTVLFLVLIHLIKVQ